MVTDVSLLHLHLPKTGGTALRHFFIHQLGESRVSPALQGMMLDEALIRWDHASVISGHLIARQGDEIPSDRQVLTVLRNPVERFLSEYFYNKHDVDNLLVEASQRAGDLDAYLENAQPALVQIDMLYPLGTDKQLRLSGNERLEAAMRAIDHAAFVGIQEDMDDFCAMLCARFGWSMTAPDQINVTSRRVQSTELAVSQRKKIEALLEPELLLYAHAKSRFKKDRRHLITFARTTEVREQPSATVTEPCPLRPPASQQIKPDFGDRRAEIDSVQIVGRVSGPGHAMTGEIMDILFNVTAHEPLSEVTAGIAIKDELGSLAFGTNSMLLGDIYSVTPGKYVIQFTTLNRLGPGEYAVDAALTPTLSHYDGCFHWRHSAARFSVPAYATQHFEGRVLMDMQIDIAGHSQDATWCKKLPVTEGHAARTFGNSSAPMTSFQSSLDIMSCIDKAGCDSDVLLQVRIENRGSETWVAGGRYPVKLSYRWLDDAGNVVVADGTRTDLPGNLSPDSNALTYIHIRTPEKPGRFHLAISLVQEHVAWFIDRDGTNGRVLPVTIV